MITWYNCTYVRNTWEILTLKLAQLLRQSPFFICKRKCLNFKMYELDQPVEIWSIWYCHVSFPGDWDRVIVLWAMLKMGGAGREFLWPWEDVMIEKLVENYEYLYVYIHIILLRHNFIIIQFNQYSILNYSKEFKKLYNNHNNPVSKHFYHHKQKVPLGTLVVNSHYRI